MFKKKKFIFKGLFRIFFLIFSLFLITGCMSTNKIPVKIDSVPSDALISVHETLPDGSNKNLRVVAGTTPVEKLFDFGKNDRLWLEIEKRGYQPEIVEIGPKTNQTTITLEPMRDADGQKLKEYSIPKLNRILVVEPKINVIKRGFSKEQISEEKSRIAQEESIKGIKRFFSNECQIKIIKKSLKDNKYLKTLWRDIKTVMEMVDPIRYKYQVKAPLLETRSSQNAAKILGEKYKGEAIFFLTGKQNIESAGMKIGKIAMSTIGTAASYASSYSRAMARGGGLFVYNIYIPYFSEGTLLKAALVDCESGEILWINKGIWKRFSFEDQETVENILADLLLGLK